MKSSLNPQYVRAGSMHMISSNSLQKQLLCWRERSGPHILHFSSATKDFSGILGLQGKACENQWPRKSFEVPSSSPNGTDWSGLFEGAMMPIQKDNCQYLLSPTLPSFFGHAWARDQIRTYSSDPSHRSDTRSLTSMPPGNSQPHYY